MSLLEREICEVAELIWERMFQLPIKRLEEDDPRLEEKHLAVTSCIKILGSIECVVILETTEPLARSLAGLMFGRDPSHLSSEDLVDTVNEIANMFGGNIKSVLPECGLDVLHLSRPANRIDLSGLHAVAETNWLSCTVAFSCSGEVLSMTVLLGEVRIHKAGPNK